MNKKISEAIKLLEKEGYEIKKEDKVVVKLYDGKSYEAKIIEWDKPYNEIEVPKGWRMLNVSEAFYLFETKQFSKITDEENICVWLNQLPNDIREEYSRGLDMFESSLLSYWGNLDYSNAVGRVVFIKEVGK